MDLQYQLGATCHIGKLQEINGQFVMTAGCDLHRGVKKPLRVFGREVLCVGVQTPMACDTVIWKVLC